MANYHTLLVTLTDLYSASRRTKLHQLEQTDWRCSKRTNNDIYYLIRTLIPTTSPGTVSKLFHNFMYSLCMTEKTDWCNKLWDPHHVASVFHSKKQTNKNTTMWWPCCLQCLGSVQSPLWNQFTSGVVCSQCTLKDCICRRGGGEWGV